MKAVLLGSGKAAGWIAPALQEAGLDWVQVYSPTLAHASALAKRLGGIQAIDSIERLNRTADIYMLAVTDRAVSALGGILRLPGKTVFHISGSMPLSALQDVSEHHGVMYFFQTFSKEGPAPDFRQTPVCIEASNERTAGLLSALSGKISGRVCFLSSEQREILHLGGVFVNNYVNLMYTAAFDLFNEKGLDFSMLYPLMEQTLQKAIRISPVLAQTGPALRKDDGVLQKHLQILSLSKQGKQYTELYRLLSQAIENRFASFRSGC